MSEGRIQHHAHGPRERDRCRVNGGSFPPKNCAKCKQDVFETMAAMLFKLGQYDRKRR